MVGDRLDWSVRCQRCLQQGYELGVEFRFNSSKVEQDIVLGYATDHRWIKPPQRLHSRLRLERGVTKSYG
jgi:hypothetical protein